MRGVTREVIAKVSEFNWAVAQEQGEADLQSEGKVHGGLHQYAVVGQLTGRRQHGGHGGQTWGGSTYPRPGWLPGQVVALSP